MPLFKTTTLDVDNITEDGLFWVNGVITGAPLTSFGLLLNVKNMGTPFQMYFADNNLYVYKRYYTGGAWTAWEKIRAGYADSAGSATNATNATNATKVNNWFSSRPTSANVQFGDGFLRHFKATSAMTTGKPTIGDGHIIDLAWDYDNGYDVQLAIGNSNSGIQFRSQLAGAWQNWLTLIHSGNIGSQSVNHATSAGTSSSCSGNSATATTAAKLGRSGDTNTPMTFNWSGQSGQPSWLWGGSDGTNMYVYNPSNFSVKRTKELNYATDTTDLNSANGNGWYSVAEAANANYDGHKPLAINWYWGIDMRTRGIAYTKINGYEILTKENGLPKTGGNINGGLSLAEVSGGGIAFYKGSYYVKLGNMNLAAQPNLTDNHYVYFQNANGTIGFTGSSRRIKENIRDITEEEAKKILEIDVVKFDYKKGSYRYQPYLHPKNSWINPP